MSTIEPHLRASLANAEVVMRTGDEAGHEVRWPKIEKFVTAITAKARRSVYVCRLPRNGGNLWLRSSSTLSLLLLSRLVRSQVQETTALARLP
jgi:hypothetical protein